MEPSGATNSAVVLQGADGERVRGEILGVLGRLTFKTDEDNAASAQALLDTARDAASLGDLEKQVSLMRDLANLRDAILADLRTCKFQHVERAQPNEQGSTMDVYLAESIPAVAMHAAITAMRFIHGLSSASASAAVAEQGL
jgi:hypothetical protein